MTLAGRTAHAAPAAHPGPAGAGPDPAGADPTAADPATDPTAVRPAGADPGAQRRRLERLREALPAVRLGGCFNSGYTGPLCSPAQAAIVAATRREHERGRMGPGPRAEVQQGLQDARGLVAELLHAPVAEVALTQHTTEGVNTVVLGLPWRPGDNVVSTRIEHKGVLLPLGVLRARHGVDVRAVGWDPAEPMRALTRRLVEAIDGRTRLVALSHVSYVNGAVLDLAPVIDAAHRHGALVLIDGAQSVGVLPVDLRELDADAYTVSGQKWLCGPEGTGALLVRTAALDRIAPTVVGWASVDTWELDGSFVPNPDASRYEVGTRSRPLVAGFAAALRWLRDDVGLPWAARRTAGLADRLRDRLPAAGAVVLTPDEHAGLVSFRLPLPPEELVRRLAGRGTTVRSIAGYDCVRASVGWFHTEDEIDELAGQVAEVVR